MLRLVVTVIVTLVFQLALALMGEALTLKELLFLFLISGVQFDITVLRTNLRAVTTQLGIKKPRA